MTRRELRLAAARCTQVDPVSVTRRDLRLAEKRAQRRRLAPVRPASSTAMAVTIALTAALLGCGAAQGYGDHQVRVAQQRVEAAVALAFANRVRADRADGARLGGAAIAFATVKRSEAVGHARAVVAQAVSARATSAPDVTPETLTPLDDALVSLSALIEAAPIAPVAQPAPVLFELSATAPADDPFALGTPDPTATTADRPAGSAGSAVPAGATNPSKPAAAPDAAPPAGTTAKADADAGTTAMEAVDLGLSAQMLVAAQLVTDLSAQVQAVAETNVATAAAAAEQEAAQAAAAEAARVAREAQRAAAAAVARKVEAVKDSPNGAIPADLLCGVSFDDSALIRCDAAQALELLAAGYRAEFGSFPGIVSSYRSFSEQIAVRQSRGGLAAVPGSSNHGRGLAVDFANFGSVGQFSAPTYRWMSDHADEFGWHHPAIMEPGGGGPQEPWHWEFDTD
ncbi:D-alanyl-D-alanine carboxypeptidase family protein [Pengzhenrongella phosphoraccumulans]|uniref:D-alanyl-D-alanine carboxypeptidase family protein n=1 Tax=Pengzhenrongella phosphoraccumulans TaxID=3114394 RepID=UPI00388F0643